MDFAQLNIKLRQTLANLPLLVGQEAVNFFQEQITQEVNVRNVPHKKRRFELRNRRGRKILIKTGALRRSIRIKNITPNSVTITSDLPYSKIHNEGGEIEITPKMRKFFWAKFYETSASIKTNKNGNGSLSQRNKAIGAEAMFWRNLALKHRAILRTPCRVRCISIK